MLDAEAAVQELADLLCGLFADLIRVGHNDLGSFPPLLPALYAKLREWVYRSWRLLS
jgi:hypothetical protein